MSDLGSYDLLASLTLSQRIAATYAGDRVLVRAGPGSGKTRVIAARVAWLVLVKGFLPTEVLVVTFTRSAAAEIRTRVASAIGADAAAKVLLLTFHALALRVLRTSPASGLPRSFAILSGWEEKAVLDALFSGPTARPEAKEVGTKGFGRDLARFAATGLEPATDAGRRLLTAYRTRLVALRATTRDLLVPLALAALDAEPLAGAATDWERWIHGLRHVLIDESQDATPAEAELVARIATGRTLLAVGDSSQAIFGWRHARAEAVEEAILAADLPPTIERVSLDKGFRFGTGIRDAARAFASFPDRYEVREGSNVLEFPENENAVPLCLREFADLRGSKAVLARTRWEVASLVQLDPARFDSVERATGADPFPHLEPLRLACRLWANPGDSSALRRLWRLAAKDGVAMASSARMLDGLAREAGLEHTLLSAWLSTGEIPEGWDEPPRILTALVKMRAGSTLLDLVKAAAPDGAPLPTSEALLAEAVRTVEDLGLWMMTLEEGLDALSDVEAADAVEAVAKRGLIPVLTIHAAKGREWDNVLLYARTGWPGPRDEPEEMRVAFVAATRARETLVIQRHAGRTFNGGAKW